MKQEVERIGLGIPGDALLTYPLSYIQADRAVAVLKTLGYPIVEYTGARNTDNTLQVIDFDGIFSAKSSGTPLSRPAVINFLDAQVTSLVEDDVSAVSSRTTALAGGQPLKGMTDGSPQQRLLIVYDESDRRPLYQLLDLLQGQIDVPSKQILIEALVIELDKDSLYDIGVDFSGSKDNYDVSFEEEGGVAQPFSFVFTRPQPRTLLDFMIRLRALVDRGQATVLSRPSVLVLDGRQARIKVGEEIPFTEKLAIEEGVLVANNAYLSTGIILNLRPRAASDNSEVTLQVETIISAANNSRILPDLGVLVAPTVQSRQVQTLVRVANDTPFVIGGLIAATDQRNTVGIPGLSSLRWVGRLFRKEQSVRESREVIVVITPHIVAADDNTFTYTVPRDAPGDADSRSPNPSSTLRSRRDLQQGAHREVATKNPSTKDAASGLHDIRWSQDRQSPPNRTPSIFDSFESSLFRNYYRVRSYDLLDFNFIIEDPTHQSRITEARQLARQLTGVPFEALPPIDRSSLVKEVRRLLAARAVDKIATEATALSQPSQSSSGGSMRSDSTETSARLSTALMEMALSAGVERRAQLYETLKQSLKQSDDKESLAALLNPITDTSRVSMTDDIKYLINQAALDSTKKKQLTSLIDSENIAQPPRAVDHLLDEITFLGLSDSAEKYLHAEAIELARRTPTDEEIQTFLTLVRGGVPGEEILVEQMMIRLVENFEFDRLVSPEEVILFTESGLGPDPKHLVWAAETPEADAGEEASSTGSTLSFETCLRQGRTFSIQIPSCAVDQNAFILESASNNLAEPTEFHPPIVGLRCIEVPDAIYFEKLRELNAALPTILLNSTFSGRGGRNPLQMLQGVLVLERILELNDDQTLPRTIHDFHVGREIVFPTREDLETRKHLIDCRTANLFYQTMNYYEVFEKAYNAREPKLTVAKVREYSLSN